ncbi:MAG: hypothetical protein ABIZ04_02435 [Opitutus sp.]
MKLPPMIVEETAGPKWRYAELPGYEILSRCDDARTRQLFLAFYRAHALLGAMLPARFQLELDVPKAMIFYDEELWPVAQQETVAAMLGLHPPSRPEASRDEESPRQSARDALVPSSGLSALGLKPRGENRTSMFFSNMCLSDTDSLTTFALVSHAVIDEQDTFLTPAYVETLLNRRTPQLPAWFRAGFLKLYEKLRVQDGAMTIMRPSEMSVASSSAPLSFSVSPRSFYSTSPRFMKSEVKEDISLNIGPSYLGAPSFAPLSKTLVNGVLSIGEVLNGNALKNGLNESIWLAEIELFVRWGIDPSDASRSRAFWQFIERAVSEPFSEKLFQECFGFDFAEGTQQLTAFLPSSDRMKWSLGKESFHIRPLEIREASRGEISRIKGEWERLETRYIKMNLPDLELLFVKQARGTLRRAFDKGDRDPRLVATLGLLEVDAGESSVARGYFEGEPNKALVRPRANFELARLRYDETDGRSHRDDGKISEEQAFFVVEPLLIASRQKPSISQVYELMADVWVNCVAPPPPAVLDALKMGVRLFPRDGELVYRVAVLNAVNDPREASRLVKLGIQYAANDSAKLRFLELRGKLARPTVPDPHH